jgi:hypothetical protein
MVGHGQIQRCPPPQLYPSWDSLPPSRDASARRRLATGLCINSGPLAPIPPSKSCAMMCAPRHEAASIVPMVHRGLEGPTMGGGASSTHVDHAPERFQPWVMQSGQRFLAVGRTPPQIRHVPGLGLWVHNPR